MLVWYPAYPSQGQVIQAITHVCVLQFYYIIVKAYSNQTYILSVFSTITVIILALIQPLVITGQSNTQKHHEFTSPHNQKTNIHLVF